MSSTKSRKDTRAVVALRARYRSPATFEYVQEACCDVSVGGMFIKSDSPAAAGTLLKLECETDTEGAKIRGVARVVWLREAPNEHGPSGMGVKFVKLESGSKDLISHLVQRLADQGVHARSISGAPEAGRQAPSIVGSAAPGAAPTASGAPASGAPSRPASKSSSRPAEAGRVSSQPAVAAPAASGHPTPSAAHIDATAAAQPDSTPASANSPVPAASADDDAGLTSVAGVPESADAQAAHSADVSAQESSAGSPPLAASPDSSAEASAFAEANVPKRSSAGMVWIAVIAATGILLAIIFSDDSRGSSKPNEVAPAQLENEPGVADGPAPADESATTATAAEEPPSAAAAEPEHATNEPAQQPPDEANDQEAPPSAATTTANEGNSQPARGTEQAPEASAEQPGAAEPSEAAAESPPTTGPTVVSASPGDHVISFVSRPEGATIAVGDKSIVAPGQMNIGAMPTRVRVNATKDGFEASSAWVDTDGFKRVKGVFHKRVYMALHVEAPEGDVPAKRARKP